MGQLISGTEVLVRVNYVFNFAIYNDLSFS